MKTVCFTSDNHMWLLRGFLYQWRKYALHDGSDLAMLEVAGFTDPHLDVPFVSIGKFEDYPIDRWSDALIKYLTGIKDNLVLILLEDYWLMKPINWRGVLDAVDTMTQNKNILRFDLSSDRMFSKDARYVASTEHLDLCFAKGDYSLSFQAGIFRRELLLEILRPGETPWQSELNGTARLNETIYSVLGSYQWPINYMIVMNKGKIDYEGKWMFPARSLSGTDWMELNRLGYTEREHEHAL